MNQVEFVYNGNRITIQCKENDIINKIIKSFANKASIEENKINSLIILYGGKKMTNDEQKLTFNKIANKEDRIRKIMSIIVYDKETEIKKNKILTKSKYIICPNCQEFILIKITNYRIKLFNCKNNHIIDNLSFKDFEKTQYIDYSKIICENCKERSLTEFNMDKFYKCYECNINLCIICRNIHEWDHNIMEYSKINYICRKHNDNFTNYCENCKMNICMECEDEHKIKKHNLIYFGSIVSDKKQLSNEIQNIKKLYIDKCNKDFTQIIIKLNEAKDIISAFDFYNQLYNEITKSFESMIEITNELKYNFNSYYNIKNDIISNFQKNQKYYHILINLKEIENNDDLIEDINKIILEENIKNKLENIKKIYKRINNISEEEKLYLDKEKRDLKEKVKKLEKENEQIKLDKEKLEKISKKSEKENEQLKVDNLKLEENIEQLNIHYMDLEENIELLKKENENFEEKNIELEKNIESLQKCNSKLKNEKDKLEKEKDELERLNEELNEKIKQLELKKDNLEKELKDKRVELNKEKANNDNLKNKIETDKLKKDNFEKDYNNIKFENIKLLKKIKKIESESNEIEKKLQKENKDLKLENDNLKKESKNANLKQLDLEKQIKTKSDLITKNTKENKDLTNRINKLNISLTEERKKRYELEKKLDKNEDEDNSKFYQTFNNFNKIDNSHKRDNLNDRRSGRNRNLFLDRLNNEKQYNNYSYTVENEICPKCRINSDKLEKYEKENESMQKKIYELIKENKMLIFENNTLSKNKNQSENDENKSSIINYIIDKGINQETNLDKYDPGNKFLIIRLIQKDYIKSKKIAEVMLEVDRGNFAPDFPYADRPISINYKTSISAPHMHALALEYLSEYCVQHSRILDVGSGSGFLTLALSKLANDKGTVVGIEHIPELYNFGIKNVEKFNADLIKEKKIVFVKGDGRKGYKNYAPYKAIHVGAASEFVPPSLIEQLDYNGRIFIPIGKKHQTQKLYIIDKDELGNITEKVILSVCYGMLTDIDSQLNQ